MLPCSDLQGLSLSLLAIIILQVSALYDKTKWVGRCLWILFGLLYIITITLSTLIMKSSYGECIFVGIGETLCSTNPQRNLRTSRRLGCAYRSMSRAHPMQSLLYR